MMPENDDSKETSREADPFDRVYSRWAEYALDKNLDPPSREQWDRIVLRLLMSEDPNRVRRYRNLEDPGSEGLGSDAYGLWSKMPEYTPNRAAALRTVPDLHAYEQEHTGSMKQAMEAQGLGERYAAILKTYEELRAARAPDPVRVRQAQTRIMIMGCAGMAAIAFMLLIVLTLAAL